MIQHKRRDCKITQLQTLTLMLLLIGLSACGAVSFSPTFDISVNAPKLTYSASLNAGTGSVGFTSSDFNITARTRAGSVGGTLTGYKLEYVFADGSQVLPGDSVITGSLSAVLAPGLACSGEVTSCTVNQKGVAYVDGAPVEAGPLPGVPGQIAAKLWCDNRTDIGARVLLSLEAVDDRGVKAVTDPVVVAIEEDGDFIPPNLDRPTVCESIL